MRVKLLALLLVISGCSGQMEGVIRGTGERVQFQYEQGLESDIYSATIGTESFSGKAVMDGASSFFGTGFGSGSDFIGSGTTNKFVAVLLGDNGSSLNCQMRYADSSGLTSLGGVGVCQHSDGRTIDIIW